METLEKARLISRAALDKKAEDIVIMDMRAVSNIADYFVVCSASSSKRVQAISEGIEDALLGKGIDYWHIEGRREALWVLIDYGDVIAHIFHENVRGFYNLERLWQDAPKEYFVAPCESNRSKKK
ncbi:MAG: ribosome silencing factor [Omnitrophica bacterium RBG_13_46_9]|nr:MAG: ribosome silencing factor [Omnitrophica bacterium RBG_13_46_9]